MDGFNLGIWRSAAIHAILLAGIFVTVGVFETAKRKPVYFGGLGERTAESTNEK